jgi:hypothetical protein
LIITIWTDTGTPTTRGSTIDCYKREKAKKASNIRSRQIVTAPPMMNHFGRAVTFCMPDEVAEKGEILLRYKKENQDPVINPAKMHKGKKVTLQFGIHDKVVVLAEDSSVRS